jgi:hypothetical protein
MAEIWADRRIEAEWRKKAGPDPALARRAFAHACKNSLTGLIEEMKRDPDLTSADIESNFLEACKTGNAKTAEALIAHLTLDAITDGFEMGCKKGNLGIVQILLPVVSKDGLKLGLKEAALHQQKKVVSLISARLI